VVAREEATSRDLLRHLRALPNCTDLPLGELDLDAATLLVRRRLQRLTGSDAVPERLVDQLVAKGAGNPFFLEELASYAHDRRVDPDHVEAVDLPEDIQRIVISRLDALEPPERAVIKAASVIGATFPASWIHGSFPEAGTDDEVAARLGRLARLDLVRVNDTSPELEYAFKHAVIREVAYAMLGSDTRAALHEAVGAHIERTHPSRLTQYADQLAHHYGRTGNTGKQRVWFRAAGEAAQAAYANDAAIAHYRRLLPLLPDAETPGVLVRLGTVWQLTGQWTEAERAYRQAMVCAASAGDQGALAAAHRELGILLTATRSYDEAVNWLTTAAEEFTALGDQAGLMWTLDRLAFALHAHGDYPHALAVAERQLAGQQTLGDVAGMGAAADNLGVVHWLTGDYAKALELLRWSYQLAEESGDVRIVVHAANDLAGLYVERGDHGQAVEYLQRAAIAAERIGYRQAVVVLTSNAGEIYRERGAFAEATRCHALALQGALELGDWNTIVYCVSGLAVTAAESDAPGFKELLHYATELADASDPFIVADLRHRQALIAAREHRLADAETLCGAAEELATQLQARGLQLRIHVLRVRLAVEGHRRDAHEAAAELTMMLPDWTDPPESALLHETIYEFDPRAISSRDRAAELYRQLYEHAPSVEYAAVYRRLTGDPLPSPPPLPPLGAIVAASPDIETLLRKVKHLRVTRDLAQTA
jgi:predicted ATPase